MLRLPCRDWLKTYSVETLGSDLVAAVIVTIMLIPQSLAYALLAGLPAEMGLYASILPLVAYALLGSSRTLSVGPVAVVSLMTATAVGNVTRELQVDYATAAITLALLSGTLLILLGLIRFGFVANLLSHPVVSGFITSSGILIGLSQLSHILGTDAGGDTLPSLLSSLLASLETTNLYTLAIGAFALLFLQLCRSRLAGLLSALGMARSTADLVTKAAPVMAVALTILLAALGNLEAKGVALVGAIPQG
ncbi:MAG: SulP family inorganic anion transporter, partial [Luminiphilus sp.]